MNKELRESGQDYLETILILETKGIDVRSIDIAEKNGFSRASVSVAMKLLENQGYISIGEHKIITLTEKGRQIAEMIYERHRIISGWLESMGVDKTIAEEDACKIEHDLSKESFTAIKSLISLTNKN